MELKFEGKIVEKVEIGRFQVKPNLWYYVYAIVEKVTIEKKDTKGK